MFAKRKAVIEMPADAAASAAGGAMGYAGFWARVAAVSLSPPTLIVSGVVLALVLTASAKPAAAQVKPPPTKAAAATEAKKAAPAPAKPAATPATAPSLPLPEAKSFGDEKPKAKAKRRAAPRKPAVPMTAAEAPPAPPARTPKYNDVMTAVMYRDYLAATELLDLGWWADRPDSNGVTPLMAAALNGDALIAQLLLKHGANPNRSGPGGSVLSYAGRSGDAKLVALLKQAGAR